MSQVPIGGPIRLSLRRTDRRAGAPSGVTVRPSPGCSEREWPRQWAPETPTRLPQGSCRQARSRGRRGRPPYPRTQGELRSERRAGRGPERSRSPQGPCSRSHTSIRRTAGRARSCLEAMPSDLSAPGRVQAWLNIDPYPLLPVLGRPGSGRQGLSEAARPAERPRHEPAQERKPLRRPLRRCDFWDRTPAGSTLPR